MQAFQSQRSLPGGPGFEKDAYRIDESRHRFERSSPDPVSSRSQTQSELFKESMDDDCDADLQTWSSHCQHATGQARKLLNPERPRPSSGLKEGGPSTWTNVVEKPTTIAEIGCSEGRFRDRSGVHEPQQCSICSSASNEKIGLDVDVEFSCISSLPATPVITTRGVFVSTESTVPRLDPVIIDALLVKKVATKEKVASKLRQDSRAAGVFGDCERKW